MRKLIEKHTLLHHGGAPESQHPSHIYMIAGLCDVTCKLSNFKTHYKEIIFTESPYECTSRVKHEIYKLHNHILDQNYIPIFSTIIPSHLEKLNSYWLDHNVTSRLDHSSHYAEMQVGLVQAIQEINKFIPTLNQTLGLSTPCLHRNVFHNKN